MKKTIIFVLLYAFTCAGNAAINYTSDTIFRMNRYTFEICPTFYNRAATVQLQGPYEINTRPAVSARIGFTYSRYWRNGMGFKTGVRWGMIPFNFKISSPQYGQTASYKDGSYFIYYDITYWQFPLQACYHISMKKIFSMILSAGVSVDLLPDGQIESTASRTDDQLNNEQIFEKYY